MISKMQQEKILKEAKKIAGSKTCIFCNGDCLHCKIYLSKIKKQ